MTQPAESLAPVTPDASAPSAARRRLLYAGVAGAAALGGAGFAWWKFQPHAVEPGAEQALWGLEFETPAGSTVAMKSLAGKPLLLNFWATWCGPCRMANKTMAPMKEELKDKDILYLYITGETSPLKTWENMIPDIHGEHFRLTDAQWKYLSDAFKIEGVPTYLIVDREGNTTFRQTGFPGVEKMKEELLKVTK